MSPEYIQNLIAEKAQESLYLEFKRGDALGTQNNRRAELVKDVSAFANATGGKIIYGIAETKENGVRVATGYAPIEEVSITKEWVSSVIVDNTGPRLADFDVSEVPIPGGRAIVIDIQAAGTAHQNLFDHKYHQRVGCVTSALTDFQIRDLMARRTRPVANVEIVIKPITQGRDFHRYLFSVGVSNVGLVTMEKWWIDVVLPLRALKDTRPHPSMDMLRAHPLFNKMVRGIVDSKSEIESCKICYGDPFVDGRRFILHPGQSHHFDAGDAQIPQFILEIDQALFHALSPHEPPIQWTLFCNDSPPVSGQIPFEKWCNF